MSRFLFVHGWGFAPDFWEPLIDALGIDDPLLVDLEYFQSSFPRRRDSIRRSDWIPAFAGMTTESVIAVTHSFGTMWLLAHPPARLDRLIIINGFARFTETEGYRPAVPLRVEERMIQRFEAEPDATLSDFRARCGATEPFEPLIKSQLLGDLRILAEGDQRKALEALACPVLALATRDDPIVREAMTEQAFANCPNITLAWRDAGGHLLPRTDAPWCAERIREFL